MLRKTQIQHILGFCWAVLKKTTNHHVGEVKEVQNVKMFKIFDFLDIQQTIETALLS